MVKNPLCWQRRHSGARFLPQPWVLSILGDGRSIYRELFQGDGENQSIDLRTILAVIMTEFEIEEGYRPSKTSSVSLNDLNIVVKDENNSCIISSSYESLMTYFCANDSWE